MEKTQSYTMTESTPSTSDPLTTATQLVKNGRLEQAKEVLTKYLMQNPASEQGWLLMSFVLSDAAQQKDCLERVLRINPNNTVAQSRLAHLLGKRTEELFLGKGKPPSPPSARTESYAEKTPSAPALSVLPSSEDGMERPRPGSVTGKTAKEPEGADASGRKSAFSGRTFWIIAVVLIVVILGIFGTILYVGVIGPAISHLSMTSTPTPQAVVVPSLPPAWTSTLTPTITLTPIPSLTPTDTPTETPTISSIKSNTATKKT
jgi:hypothetical protein